MFHVQRIVRASAGRRLTARGTASNAEAEKQNVSPVQRLHVSDALIKELPIERQSLTRGLAMDKFEKDFFIYPEHQDADDLRNIEGFVKVLRDSLQQSVDSGEIEKSGTLSEVVKLALDRNAIVSTLVPSAFQGLGFTNKDKIRVFEELSIDFSISSMMQATNSAVSLLIHFGSSEQKEKYLPRIVDGRCRPGFAYIEQGSQAPFAEIYGSGQQLLLEGKFKAVNPQSANLMFVFALKRDPVDNKPKLSCFLIDRNELDDGSKWDGKRDGTLGLKAFEYGDLSIRCSISDDALLGEEGRGRDVANELVASGRMPFAAAVSGFAKRLVDDLSTLCNQTPSTATENTVLASSSSVQRLLTHLSTKVYALEAVTYYLGGIIDENMPILVDIESALMHRLARETLKECVSAIVELSGSKGIEIGPRYEKWIRDISTLLAMNSEGNVTEEVAMSTLSSWAVTNYSHAKSSIQRFFKMASHEKQLANPKLKHFIAEHAHPSLQDAAQELEFTMSRVHAILDKLIAERGKNLEADYASMENLVRVLQNNLIMVAVISRATRSYSIGLRNSDLEIFFATQLCTRLSRSSWFELDALSNHFNLLKLNPSLLSAGRAVLEMGGYKIENPFERNW
ncbi:unnamed protein product, partial [Mesorhabditis spiculigera]